jgi:hypothetical protein
MGASHERGWNECIPMLTSQINSCKSDANKKTEPKLRSVLWKMIPPLNSLYYLGAVKDRHFEPHAERFEHETPLWF